MTKTSIRLHYQLVNVGPVRNSINYICWSNNEQEAMFIGAHDLANNSN